MKLVYLL
jgi:RNA-directed DNA polymerase